jgi:hypothetical protein
MIQRNAQNEERIEERRELTKIGVNWPHFANNYLLEH